MPLFSVSLFLSFFFSRLVRLSSKRSRFYSLARLLRGSFWSDDVNPYRPTFNLTWKYICGNPRGVVTVAIFSLPASSRDPRAVDLASQRDGVARERWKMTEETNESETRTWRYTSMYHGRRPYWYAHAQEFSSENTRENTAKHITRNDYYSIRLCARVPVCKTPYIM